LGIEAAIDEYEEDVEGWIRTYDEPNRVWPAPPLNLSWSNPSEIRNSLGEAYVCLKAKAYTASVVMSGRALEGIGRHFFPPADDDKRHLMLGAGLEKLRDEGKIDARLLSGALSLQMTGTGRHILQVQDMTVRMLKMSSNSPTASVNTFLCLLETSSSLKNARKSAGGRAGEHERF
jgi:hypothetical protein